jgi:hypothetical protein
MDRQLEEALNHGPDPLHLASLFGIGERTAMRYADAARQLLASPPAPSNGASSSISSAARPR